MDFKDMRAEHRAICRDGLSMQFLLDMGGCPVLLLEFIIRLHLGDQVEAWRVVRALRMVHVVGFNRDFTICRFHKDANQRGGTSPLTGEQKISLAHHWRAGVREFDRGHLSIEPESESPEQCVRHQRDRALLDAIDSDPLLREAFDSLMSELVGDAFGSRKSRKRRRNA